MVCFLRLDIVNWEHPGWPETAIETGARFVYGGRESSDSEVIEALDWPTAHASPGQLTIFPETSHFLMLEVPSDFAALVTGLTS